MWTRYREWGKSSGQIVRMAKGIPTTSFSWHVCMYSLFVCSFFSFMINVFISCFCGSSLQGCAIIFLKGGFGPWERIAGWNENTSSGALKLGRWWLHLDLRWYYLTFTHAKQNILSKHSWSFYGLPVDGISYHQILHFCKTAHSIINFIRVMH